mgnify:CR=1 FL=1
MLADKQIRKGAYMRNTNISISIDKELLHKLTDMAWEFRMSRSELISKLINLGLEKVKQNPEALSKRS